MTLFVDLSKYKASLDVTPEENYSTELLAFILKYSTQQKTDLFAKFMDMLGEKISTVEYGDYEIDTQVSFTTTSNHINISDLLIHNKNTGSFSN